MKTFVRLSRVAEFFVRWV